MISGVYDEDGIPVVSRSLAISDFDLVRLLSLKAQHYADGFEDTQNLATLEKSLSMYAKIDTLINKQLFSLQFERSQLNFLTITQGYYGEAIEVALRLYQQIEDQKYLNLAYFFSSKTKAIILQNRLNEGNAFQSIASPEMIRKEKENMWRHKENWMYSF